VTLALALRAADGLVLATDSRVTGGQQRSADVSQKFLQVNRDLGVMTYGLAIPGSRGLLKLVNDVNPPHARRLAYFTEISELAGRVFREEFEKWVQELPEEQRPEITSAQSVGFILGGYDSNETSQFRILHWSSPAFEPEERSDILAAQWHVSGLISRFLYYPEMSVAQLKKLAVFCLIETSAVESTVGGPIQMATITLAEGFKRIYEQEIQQMLLDNQPRHARFRSLLRQHLILSDLEHARNY
jgi:20S proteasome alpha/beta subunit